MDLPQALPTVLELSTTVSEVWDGAPAQLAYMGGWDIYVIRYLAYIMRVHEYATTLTGGEEGVMLLNELLLRGGFLKPRPLGCRRILWFGKIDGDQM